jgi:hypothetical protein
MLDFAVDLDNSSHGKRSICILACVFAVDFGNRIIPGFGLYRRLRQTAGPQTIVKAAMIEAATKRVCGAIAGSPPERFNLTNVHIVSLVA